MRTKIFDCLAMKRRGAERVYELIKTMTLDEEVAFWAERTQALRERLAEKRKTQRQAS